MEFTTTKNEIKRRKQAFLLLLCTLMLGIILFSTLLNVTISIIGYSVLIAVLIIFILVTFPFLAILSRLKIRILEDKIEQVKDSTTESYKFADVSSLKIKRRSTATGGIREIYLSFANRNHLYLSAFEGEFEKLKDAIVSKIDPAIQIKEVREPLDFDHIFFYPVLGLLVSFMGICFFKLLLNADYSQFRLIALISSLYLFLLAIYFVIEKPLGARFGKKQSLSDYITGAVMIIAGIFLLLILGVQL